MLFYSEGGKVSSLDLVHQGADWTAFPAKGVSISPDGSVMAYLTGSGITGVRNYIDGSDVPLSTCFSSVITPEISPNGRYLVIATSQPPFFKPEMFVSVIDLESNKQMRLRVTAKTESIVVRWISSSAIQLAVAGQSEPYA